METSWAIQYVLYFYGAMFWIAISTGMLIDICRMDERHASLCIFLPRLSAYLITVLKSGAPLDFRTPELEKLIQTEPRFRSYAMHLVEFAETHLHSRVKS